MHFQHTLSKTYTFEGKGLHTGKIARMTICPAPADTGIRFRRTDIGEDAFVDAQARTISLALELLENNEIYKDVYMSQTQN